VKWWWLSGKWNGYPRGAWRISTTIIMALMATATSTTMAGLSE